MPVIDEKQPNVATADADDSRGESLYKRIGLRGLMREQQSCNGPDRECIDQPLSSQTVLQRYYAPHPHRPGASGDSEPKPATRMRILRGPTKSSTRPRGRLLVGADAFGRTITHLCGARLENCPPGAKTGDPISPPGGYLGGSADRCGRRHRPRRQRLGGEQLGSTRTKASRGAGLGVLHALRRQRHGGLLRLGEAGEDTLDGPPRAP